MVYIHFFGFFLFFVFLLANIEDFIYTDFIIKYVYAIKEKMKKY